MASFRTFETDLTDDDLESELARSAIAGIAVAPGPVPDESDTLKDDEPTLITTALYA